MTTYSDRLMLETPAAEPTSEDQSSTRPSSSSPWFAIQTRYRFENKIAAQLHGKGIETFLPVLNETHRWSDRQKTVSLPLFSGYVFVRPQASAISQMKVLQTEGVIGFVNVHGAASPIPSRQIEDLRRLLAQKVPCALRAFLRVGQRVRIRGGCLDGLEGILGGSSQKTIVVSMECIQRSLAVTLEGYELELV